MKLKAGMRTPPSQSRAVANTIPEPGVSEGNRPTLGHQSLSSLAPWEGCGCELDPLLLRLWSVHAQAALGR